MSDSARIDKYLWAIRVFKTRTEATEACKGNRVTLQGREVKPSQQVKSGDVIVVRKGVVHFTYRVVMPVEARQGAKRVPEFAENITPQSELDKLHAPNETFFVVRERGAGRPTKKERRDIDTLYDNIQVGDYAPGYFG